MNTSRQTAAVLAFCLICVIDSSLSLAQTDDCGFRDVTCHAKFIAEELRRCPLRTEIPPQDKDRRQQITNIYLSLAQYPTQVIRAGIYQYVDRYPRLDIRYDKANSKVFAFLRVVFKVPAQFPLTEQSRFPYAAPENPLKTERTITCVDFLWPYSIDDTGQLVLSGFPSTVFSGPPYDATRDFDQMAARLQRRLPATEPGG